MLMRFASSLDVETLAEAVKGIGTDDTRFIRTITTRSKRFLGRISYAYREDNDMTLSQVSRPRACAARRPSPRTESHGGAAWDGG